MNVAPKLDQSARDAAIEAAAAALASDPESAERQARAIVASAPSDPRVILILASAQRRRGDPAGARSLLEPLAAAFPRAARTQYELGLVRLAAGDAAAGIAALRQAVTLTRDMPEAWRALGDALFKAGDLAPAEAAYAEQLRAGVRDPRLKAAADALAADDAGRADQLIREYLVDFPSDPAALRMLGDALARLGRPAEAETILAACLALDPGFDGARFTYATILFQQQKAAEALPHVRRLLARDGHDPAYRNLLAACLSLVGDLDEVDELYRALLEEYPTQPRIWLNYGHALRTVRRSDEAKAAYRRCIALAPSLGDAYWSLANLKVAAFSDAELAAMQAQLARPDLPKVDRLHLSFALGKALEDRGDCAGAFRGYAAGAAIRRADLSYSADETTAQFARVRARFTADFLAKRGEGGCRAVDPIFVVGLPRSGSTLVEQILASHSDIEGTMELPDIGLIVGELAGSGGSGGRDALAVAAELSPADRTRLGEGYMASTRAHRRLGRPFFIDKMPNNFQHIWLIRMILPRARIIDVRRHPLGVGFSAFKQHFAQGQSFSYDLTDIGRYYRDYVDLMSHMRELLPGYVHRLVYEDLIDDTEAEVKRLLDYCGVPFEPACLRFFDNDRAVKTVSSEQVRRPIFRSGVEQWRSFEPWLGPLQRALGPALRGWRE